MIHVIATVTCKPGQRAAWLAAFRANRPNVLAEDGCAAYDVHLPVDAGIPAAPPSADVAVILETWASPEHLRAHLAQPHMDDYREAVKDLVAGPTALRIVAPA